MCIEFLMMLCTLIYRILISITVILVVFWIWNYVTNVYTAVFVSAGLVLAVGA